MTCISSYFGSTQVAAPELKRVGWGERSGVRLAAKRKTRNQALGTPPTTPQSPTRLSPSNCTTQPLGTKWPLLIRCLVQLPRVGVWKMSHTSIITESENHRLRRGRKAFILTPLLPPSSVQQLYNLLNAMPSYLQWQWKWAVMKQLVTLSQVLCLVSSLFSPSEVGIVYYLPFYSWEKRCSERLHNLSKVTQLIRSRA